MDGWRWVRWWGGGVWVWGVGVVVGWEGVNREEGACGALQCTVRKSVSPIQKIRKGI